MIKHLWPSGRGMTILHHMYLTPQEVNCTSTMARVAMAMSSVVTCEHSDKRTTSGRGPLECLSTIHAA